MKEYRVFRSEAAETVLTDDDYVQWNEPDRWGDDNTLCVLKVSDLLDQQKQRECYKKMNASDEEMLEDFMVVHWAWPTSK